MPNYRRCFLPGGSYFFTLVTARRRPLFSEPQRVAQFKRAVRSCLDKRPFEIVAAVMLPDHLHMIWTLPAGDVAYSVRWAAIKAQFTRDYIATGGEEASLTAGERRDGHRGVWQRRFIEHTLRDEDDLETHVNYIHYNPVKHGLVKRPVDWPNSSIHRFIRRGWLPRSWGGGASAFPDEDAKWLE